MSRYRPDPLGEYYSAASRRDAEQTIERARLIREAKLMAQGKHPSQELAKYKEICWQASGMPQLKACVLDAIKKGGLTEERFIAIATEVYRKQRQEVVANEIDT
jgi:hypothetical protein